MASGVVKAESMIRIKETRDFTKWSSELTIKEQLQVFGRLERIKSTGYFGDVKYLGDSLCELRWKNGWRVYFMKDISQGILLLLGGHKNEQEKNIKKARILAGRYAGRGN